MTADQGEERLRHLYRTEHEDLAEIRRVLRRAGLHPDLMAWTPGGGGRGANWVSLGVPASEHEKARRVLASYLDGRERAVSGLVGALYWQIGVSCGVGLVAAVWLGVATRGGGLALRVVVFVVAAGAAFLLGGLLSRMGQWWRNR